MTNSEFAILDTTISYVEEQTWSFTKQLDNLVTDLFSYEMAMQPRIDLDDIFMSVLISVNETTYKYNF